MARGYEHVYRHWAAAGASDAARRRLAEMDASANRAQLR